MAPHFPDSETPGVSDPKGVSRIHATVSAAWLVFLVFAISMLFSLGGTLSLAAASLGVWGAAASLLRWQNQRILTKQPENLPGFYLIGQWIRLAAAGLVLGLVWIFFLPGPLAAESIGLVQSKGILWILLAVGGYFFIVQTRVAAVGPGAETESSRGVAWLLLLVFGAVMTGAGLLGAIYLERQAASAAGVLILCVLAILLLELMLRGLFFWFAPRRLRENGPLVSESLLLCWIVPGSGVSREFLSRFEELTGTRLREIHAFRFLGRAIVPAVLLVLGLLWLSTSVTLVPMGHRGVRSVAGHFSKFPLEPGLHFSLPFPFGKIESVDTGKIRQESVGFASDLLLPVLWNEMHLEGEENFLLSDGDEMLTINMPVFYKVSDPVAFLLGANKPEEALRGLAQRQLLLAMTGRPVFALMSDERATVMNAVWQRLQNACNRLGLGVEIVFVGLKDMHPPVQVAEAYQAVSAAEDEQMAFIERALAYRVDQLAGAREDAFRVKHIAGLRALERQLAVAAEVSVLRALALEDKAAEQADQSSAELLRFRLWQETLATALRGKEKFLLPPNGNPELFLDYRSDGRTPSFP
jgi:regulator of protease activity HflC (stomatin/prohibitin superfamily)